MTISEHMLKTKKIKTKKTIISEYFAKLGKLGGLKGGVVRAAKLSPKKRSAIAKKAAKTRWKKEQ